MLGILKMKIKIKMEIDKDQDIQLSIQAIEKTESTNYLLITV